MNGSTSVPRYSIIVPVYNVEAYLPECVESLLNQDTAEPYEILLVDDGSTDSSGALCDEFAARDSRVRVFHKENGGVSAARNTGIRAASGQYICFCDGDDLYLPSYLSTVDATMVYEPDMVQVCGQTFTEDGSFSDICPEIRPNADGELGQLYLMRCLETETLPIYGSYYCYRREWMIKNDLTFPEDLCVNEDLDFCFRCILHAEKVCGVEAKVYLYRQHPFSAVHTPNLTKTRMQMETAAKWFRIYPCSPLADLFLLSSVQLSAHGSRGETQDLVHFCLENRECWRYAKDWRARVAVWLFRLFGVYNGSLIFRRLIVVKHKLFRRRK